MKSLAEERRMERERLDGIIAKFRESGANRPEGKYDDSAISELTKDYGKGLDELARKHPGMKDIRGFLFFTKLFSRAFGINVTIIADNSQNRKNGSYNPATNTVTINIYAGTLEGERLVRSAFPCVISHELVHWMKRNAPEQYQALEDAVLEMLKNADDYDFGAALNNEMAKYQEKYGQEITDSEAREEIVARACEDLFGSSEKIKGFMEKHYENTTDAKGFVKAVKQILEKIKRFFEKVLNLYKSRTSEARIVQSCGVFAIGDLQKKFDAAFEKALQGNAARNATGEFEQGGVRYSLNENAAAELHKALYDTAYLEEVLLRDESPAIMLAQKGVKNLPMAMNASHIRENVFDEDEARNLGLRVDSHTHYHGLGEAFFLQIIDGLDSVTEAYRGTKNASNSARRENYFLLVSTFKDKDGNVINVPVYIDEHAQFNRVFVDVNKISTAFGRTDFYDYVKRQIEKGNLVRIKNRSTSTSEPDALIAPRYGRNASAISIAQKSEKSTPDAKKLLENRVSGDDLLNAQDLIADVQELGGQVDEYGYITLYHRTSADKAAAIRSTGEMVAKENGLFFSTKQEGQNVGYGDTVVTFSIPAEKLLLDDVFDDEAHLRFPLDKPGRVSVQEYLVSEDAGNTGLHSDPEDDVKSDREILAGALLDHGWSEKERNALELYQGKSKELTELKTRRQEIYRELSEKQFRYGGEDEAARARYKELTKELEGVKRRIEKKNRELYTLERGGDTKRLVYMRGKLSSALAEKQRVINNTASKDEQLEKQLAEIEERIAHYSNEVQLLETGVSLQSVLYHEKRRAIRQWKDAAERKVDALHERHMTQIHTERVVKKAKELRAMLLENSEQKHIPDALKKPIANLLSLLDFSAIQTMRKGELTHKNEDLQAAFEEVKDLLLSLGDEESDVYGGLDLPEETLDDFKQLVKEIHQMAGKAGENGTMLLREMNSKQLQTLNKSLYSITRAVRQANDLFANERFRHVSEIALDFIGNSEQYAVREKRSKISDFLSWENMVPYYAFRRLGAAGEALFKGFMQGQDKFAFLVKDIIDFTDKLYTKKEVKEWSRQVHTFDGTNGKVYITTAQIMSLYKLWKDKDARQHILGGGGRIQDLDFGIKKKYTNDPNGTALGELVVDAMFAKLTPRQKAVADSLQRFMAEECAKWGNEVSYKRWGIRIFGLAYYFPIESDKNTVAADVEQRAKENGLFSLLHKSFTKKRVFNANNRIMIRSVFDVFASHTTDMAKYRAFALPLLDMQKFINFKEIVTKEQVAEEAYQVAVEDWNGEDKGGYFALGDTSDALAKIGVPKNKIYFDQSKAKKSMEDHPEVTKGVLKGIPELLQNPIVVAESYDNTVLIYGELYDDAGHPVMVALRMDCNSRANDGTTVNKIRSVGVRMRSMDKYLAEQNILYLDEDKKRTDTWFQALGRSTPFGGTKYGPIRSISHSGQNVNTVPNTGTGISTDDEQKDTSFTTKEVRATMEKAFGTAAYKYIEQFLIDLNGNIGGRSAAESILQKGITGHKIAAVGANLRVALLQPTAYMRLLNVMEPKYFFGGLKAGGHLKACIEKMQKYSGIALWKSLGYRDANIAAPIQTKIKHDETWKDKVVEKSMILAELGDKATWGAIWYACELETRGKRADLKVGSEEYYRAVGERFTEVIYATQVVDSTFTKSQLMRKKDFFSTLFTSFMSEPTLSYNLLDEGEVNYALGHVMANAKEVVKQRAEAQTKLSLENGESIGGYTESEKSSIQKNERFLVAESYQDVIDFIRAALSGNDNRHLFVGKISESTAQKIKKATGVDVTGNSLVLSSDDIRHLFKHHGNQQSESKRGQIAVTEQNFDNIIRAVLEPDTVDSTTDDSGAISLIFKKEIDGKVTAVTVLSKKKKALTLKSAWITKEGQHISLPRDVQAPRQTPKANESMDTVPTDSIPENGQKVKSEDKKYSLDEEAQKGTEKAEENEAAADGGENAETAADENYASENGKEAPKTHTLSDSTKRLRERVIDSYGAEVQDRARKLCGKKVDQLSADRRIAIYEAIESGQNVDKDTLAAACYFIAKRPGLYLYFGQDLNEVIEETEGEQGKKAKARKNGLHKVWDKGHARLVAIDGNAKGLRKAMVHEVFHDLASTKTGLKLLCEVLDVASVTRLYETARLYGEHYASTKGDRGVISFEQFFTDGKYDKESRESVLDAINAYQERFGDVIGKNILVEEIAAEVVSGRLDSKRFMKMAKDTGAKGLILRGLRRMISYLRAKKEAKPMLLEAMRFENLYLDALEQRGEYEQVSKLSIDGAEFADYDKPITIQDVNILRSIGRKSINAFTSEEIKKARKWAYKFYQELGVKSPFFRARFGDWREHSQDIVTVTSVPNSKQSNQRQNVVCRDTGWTIRISGHGERNTRAHAGNGYLSVRGLNNIVGLIENAVLLDSEIHEHHDNNAPNEMIAFDHKFYSLGKDEQGNVSLYKITIEDIFQSISEPNDMRFHNLRYVKEIEKVAEDTSGSSDHNDQPYTAKGGTSTTTYSISDLFAFVKQYDKEFSPKSVNKALLNEDGTPRVFYHGTRSKFTEFILQDKPSFGRALGDGFYFTPDHAKAHRFANGLFSKGQDRGGIVMPVYLRMENPYIIAEDADRTKWQNEYHKGDYDGIIDLKNQTWYVEDSTQIKSATDNIGTFDGANPDTRYSLDFEYLSEDEHELVPPKTSEGQKQKTVAHHTRAKSYKRMEAADVIKVMFSSERFGAKGSILSMKGASKKAITDYLWRQMNTTDPDKFDEIAERVADFMIRHTTLQEAFITPSDEIRFENARQALDVIARYKGKINISEQARAELIYRFGGKNGRKKGDGDRLADYWHQKDGKGMSVEMAAETIEAEIRAAGGACDIVADTEQDTIYNLALYYGKVLRDMEDYRTFMQKTSMKAESEADRAAFRAEIKEKIMDALRDKGKESKLRKGNNSLYAKKKRFNTFVSNLCFSYGGA